MKEESEKAGLKLNIQKTRIMASGPITSWQIEGEKVETVTDFIFLGSKITADGDCSHEIKRHLLFGRKAMTNLDSILKSRDITLPIKIQIVKTVFSTSHVRIWELDHKEVCSWTNCCFRIVVLEKTLERPLYFKEIKPVHLKGNQPWILIGRTDAEVEAPILWQCDVTSATSSSSWHYGRQPTSSSVHGLLQARILEWAAIPFSRGPPQPGIKPISLTGPALAGVFFPTSATKSWLTGRDTDAEKDRRQKEERAAGDEMVGWHHQLNRHGLHELQEMVEGRVAVCCSWWSHEESDTLLPNEQQ